MLFYIWGISWERNKKWLFFQLLTLLLLWFITIWIALESSLYFVRNGCQSYCLLVNFFLVYISNHGNTRVAKATTIGKMNVCEFQQFMCVRTVPWILLIRLIICWFKQNIDHKKPPDCFYIQVLLDLLLVIDPFGNLVKARSTFPRKMRRFTITQNMNWNVKAMWTFAA